MSVNELRIGDLCARIPVIQGGMGVGVSLSGLAGAVAAAGGVGVISTAQIGFRDPDFGKHPIECNLKAVGEEIRKARKRADGGIVGVNIMVATRRYEDYVKAAVDAGADLIISGAGLPMTLPEIAGNTRIAPVVSSRKSLSVISKYWKKKYDRKPDLVVIEGPEAGGHLGFTREEIFFRSLHALTYPYEPPCNNLILRQLIANVSSALQATFPLTVATASPIPTGPFTFIIFVSSISTSPGSTFCLNRALSIPAKYAVFPLISGVPSMATAPTCASASIISTPGMTGFPGKWPAKYGSLKLTHFFPSALTPSSSSSIVSISINGCLCGMISMISFAV